MENQIKGLLLWDNTDYGEKLATALNAELICDADQLNAIKDNFHQYSHIVVFCELNWSLSGDTVTSLDFSGIKMIQALRSEKEMDLPVMFLSYFDVARIVSSPDREIVLAVGHDLLQLPAAPAIIESAVVDAFRDGRRLKKLSPMELSDIKSFYCDKEGALEHLLHALDKYRVVTLTEANKKMVESELEQAIVKIHAMFSADPSRKLMEWKLKSEDIMTKNMGELIDSIAETAEGLLDQNRTEEGSSPRSGRAATDYPWTVIFLDDEIDAGHKIIQQLSGRGIRVLCSANAKDAMRDFLESMTSSQKPMVVIADYRLSEPFGTVTRHQKIQGYQFLKEIAATDHLVRLVAFSNMKRKFLMNSFLHFNVRTVIKSKKDYLTDDQIELFCDEIIELAEENYEAASLLPTGTSPSQTILFDAYKLYRKHKAYEEMERQTAFTAKDICDYLQEQIDAGQELEIEPINHVRSPLIKFKKNEDAYFRRFQDYMVARRVALWLYAVNKTPRGPGWDSGETIRQIAELLAGKKYTPESEFYRGITNTNLGLKLEDFPFNITIEERYFLHYEMGLGIIRDVRAILPAITRCAALLKELIISTPLLFDQIAAQGFKLGFIYKGKKNNDNNRQEIIFSHDGLPDIKTPGGLKETYWVLLQLVKSDKKVKELLAKTVTRVTEELRKALLKNPGPYLYALCQYFNSVNAPHTAAKNKEAKHSQPEFEALFKLIASGKEIHERDLPPPLRPLYSSAFMAYIDLLDRRLAMNEDNKKLFFERVLFHQRHERSDPMIVLSSGEPKKKKVMDY
ncbi:hypothetical protein [Mucilaginibacter sp. HD30]